MIQSASGPSVGEILESWASRWATVLQQARYGELGGVASRHYSECRDYPERLAHYLDTGIPALPLVPADAPESVRRAARILRENGIAIFLLPDRTSLAYDPTTGAWARRAF